MGYQEGSAQGIKNEKGRKEKEIEEKENNFNLKNLGEKFKYNTTTNYSVTEF